MLDDVLSITLLPRPEQSGGACSSRSPPTCCLNNPLIIINKLDDFLRYQCLNKFAIIDFVQVSVWILGNVRGSKICASPLAASSLRQLESRRRGT